MDETYFSLVIPTLNASKDLEPLFLSISNQTIKPSEIIVIDSSSEDDTAEKAEKINGVTLVTIPRCDFNHGKTRDCALRMTKTDFVCFLTQDAILASEDYFEKLLMPFEDPNIAMVSGRQLPKSDARRFEQLVREFNYSEESSIRSIDDLPNLGIKTFFATDVCSAYRKTAYELVGGFQRCNTNEDMLIAAAFLRAGYLVAYMAEAKVFHSHNLSLKQQFQRNKAVGEFLALYAEELCNASELGEGKKLAISVSKELIAEKRFTELISFGLDCIARVAGNRVGRKLAKNRDS